MPLGKNLSSIIGDYFGDEVVSLQPNQEVDFDATTIVKKIPISAIQTNPFQTRTQFEFEKIQSLAQSIKENGLMHPIAVLAYPGTESHEGESAIEKYVLIAGERRLRACKMLDWTDILAVVKSPESISPAQQAMLTAVENLQREDLSPLELANTFQMLMVTQNSSPEKVAEVFGFSAQYIKNYLRLLTLAQPVKQALLERKLTEGQARPLVGLPEYRQEEVLKEILQKDLTVKEIQALVKKINQPAPIRPVSSVIHNLPQDVVSKAQRLAEQFPGSNLQCSGDSKKGKIVIKWG